MEQRQKKNYPHQGGAPRPYKSGSRPMGRPVPNSHIYELYNHGTRRLSRLSTLELFLLSVLAGGFMCLASLFALLLSANQTLPGAQYLLSGFGLTIGMLLISLTHGALFTEGNIFSSRNFNHVTVTQGMLRLLRFWVTTFIGNVVGVLIFCLFAYLANQNFSEAVRSDLIKLASLKLNTASIYTFGTFWGLFFSGIVANFVIAFGGIVAFASRNLINQFILLFFIFTFIAATNFQFFPINLSYFFMDAFFSKSISLFSAFFLNLLPVGIGNIVGASLMTGFLLIIAKKN